MWILPNQTVIRYPRAVTIDGIQHPKEIFRYWKPEELKALGIKPYVEVRYNNTFYSNTGETVTELDGIVKKTYTVKERYTIIELKLKIDNDIKEQLRLIYERIQKEIAFLTEFDPMLDSLTALGEYKDALVAAYVLIKADLAKITDYTELIEYRWDKHYPSSPFDIGV
jgi:hypothetical protein